MDGLQYSQNFGSDQSILMHSCACTGHRPYKFPWRYNDSDPRCLALKAALLEQIIALVNNGVVNYFSGMAEGVDTWFALSVLSLREKNPELKLHCVLPCVEQADKWSVSSQELSIASISTPFSSFIFSSIFIPSSHPLRESIPEFSIFRCHLCAAHKFP